MFSELIYGVYSVEGNMRIQEGDYSSYVDVAREFELAVTDPSSGPSKEESVIIPQSFS